MKKCPGWAGKTMEMSMMPTLMMMMMRGAEHEREGYRDGTQTSLG
jgi:hypothetical protein